MSFGQLRAEAQEALGLLFEVGEIVQPGHGFNIDPASIDPKSVATYVTRAKDEGIDNAERRTPENNTPTTFREWCEYALKPAVFA